MEQEERVEQGAPQEHSRLAGQSLGRGAKQKIGKKQDWCKVVSP